MLAVEPYVAELDQGEQETAGGGWVSPVIRATSLNVSDGCCASNALITARPRSSDCTNSDMIRPP